jgi:hypothetical protein
VTAPRELLDQLDALHAAENWRHLRYTEPHPAEPVTAQAFIGPSKSLEAPCAACGDGEVVWFPAAALIVAAVNALPGLVAAVRTALAPHYPVAVRDRKGQHTHDVCSDSWNPWPCATYRAITAALAPGRHHGRCPVTEILTALGALWALVAVAAGVALGRALRDAAPSECPHAQPDPEPAWDETWADVWPTDDLTDAEVERRFARIVGWVEP